MYEEWRLPKVCRYFHIFFIVTRFFVSHHKYCVCFFFFIIFSSFFQFVSYPSEKKFEGCDGDENISLSSSSVSNAFGIYDPFCLEALSLCTLVFRVTHFDEGHLSKQIRCICVSVNVHIATVKVARGEQPLLIDGELVVFSHLGSSWIFGAVMATIFLPLFQKFMKFANLESWISVDFC